MTLVLFLGKNEPETVSPAEKSYTSALNWTRILSISALSANIAMTGPTFSLRRRIIGIPTYQAVKLPVGQGGSLGSCCGKGTSEVTLCAGDAPRSERVEVILCDNHSQEHETLLAPLTCAVEGCSNLFMTAATTEGMRRTCTRLCRVGDQKLSRCCMKCLLA